MYLHVIEMHTDNSRVFNSTVSLLRLPSSAYVSRRAATEIFMHAPRQEEKKAPRCASEKHDLQESPLAVRN